MINALEKASNKKTIVLIVLIFIPLFFFLLGIPHLWDGDESYYAEVSHQMLVRNDWVAPYFNYTSPSFDKPPFIFWVNVFFYRLFGMNEYSSRLGSALFALFGVILVYCFGKKLFNKRTGILAALMLGTGFGFFVESQMTLIDTTLTFFITAVLYCFFIGYIEGKPCFFLIMGIPLGLGILTKGPVAFALSGGTGLILWLYLTIKQKKKVSALFNWHLLGGFFITSAICLPWYLAMWLRYKDVFIQSHFGYHMFKRFTTTIESHGGSEWYYYLYYVVFLIIGFLPWSGNLVGAFRMGVKERADKNIFFILSWAAVVFIFFTISKTKLPGYVIPLLPPVALLVGRWWDSLLASNDSPRNLRWGIVTQLAGSVLLLVFFLLLRSKVPAGYEDLYHNILIIPISLVLASLIIAILYLRNKNKDVLFKTSFFTFYLFWALLYITLTQIGGSFQPVKELSTDLKKHLHKQDQVLVNIMGAFSAPFYTNHPVRIIYENAKIAQILHSKQHIFAMLDQTGIQYFKDNHIPYYLISKHHHGYLISNRPVRE